MGTEKMKIIFTDDSNDLRHKQLIKGLVDYNDSSGPLENNQFIAFYVEDDQGDLLGGLHGNFEWDFLVIKRLWVAEHGKGLGSQLLKKAETKALEKGKKGVWLDTFEFQAREFYEKQGYTVFGEIPEAAGDFDRYFLMKRF